MSYWCIYQMNAPSSCHKGIQFTAALKAQVSLSISGPLKSCMGCWLLLRVTTPCGIYWYLPNHHRAHWSMEPAQRGSGRNCFFTYGTVLPIGKKSNFYTPKGCKTLMIIFEKGLFKTEPYWKKSAFNLSYASKLCYTISFPAVLNQSEIDTLVHVLAFVHN